MRMRATRTFVYVWLWGFELAAYASELEGRRTAWSNDDKHGQSKDHVFNKRKNTDNDNITISNIYNSTT